MVSESGAPVPMIPLIWSLGKVRLMDRSERVVVGGDCRQACSRTVRGPEPVSRQSSRTGWGAEEGPGCSREDWTLTRGLGREHCGCIYPISCHRWR